MEEDKGIYRERGKGGKSRRNRSKNDKSGRRHCKGGRGSTGSTRDIFQHGLTQEVKDVTFHSNDPDPAF